MRKQWEQLKQWQYLANSGVFIDPVTRHALCPPCLQSDALIISLRHSTSTASMFSSQLRVAEQQAAHLITLRGSKLRRMDCCSSTGSCNNNGNAGCERGVEWASVDMP